MRLCRLVKYKNVVLILLKIKFQTNLFETRLERQVEKDYRVI